MSDPTALFAYGINLGDGSAYYLTRRDIFDEIDDMYDDDPDSDPPELRDGIADFLRDRLAGFSDPEPDYGEDPDGWNTWNRRRTAAHATLTVDLIGHGDDSDTALILAAKPTYRTDWNRPVSVPHAGSLAPLFKAVSEAMAKLGVESSERPGWLLAAYGS